jgi:hypothetical protein
VIFRAKLPRPVKVLMMWLAAIFGWYILLVWSMTPSPGPPVILKSPSGRYTATQTWVQKKLYEEQKKPLPYFEFSVFDSKTQQQYQVPMNFSARHRTTFVWDQQDRLWIYSGDIGTYIFFKDEFNNWVKTTWRESGLPKPPGLP